MKKTSLAAFVFMFLFISVWVMAEKTANNPVAVSPGSETEVVTVWQSCPTFSWSAADQAASYRVAVFESVDANVINVVTYETMAAMASPVVSKDIPGPALSWTLSADEKLKTGGQYTWYVQALDVNGNALGPWSGGRIFKVEQELRFAGVEEKLGEVLKSYGVKDETITNVLSGMKSEVQEVVVSNTGGKNTPGLSRIKGYEGETNTFYGLDAGASTTGNYNTFVGSNAGYANTTGNYNLFLGYYAGRANLSGSYNLFLGAYAGHFNNSGTYNMFIGEYAGESNNTASHNMFIGYNAGLINTTGTYNTFIGEQAGKSNLSGESNVFLSYNAGYTNYEGDHNTFLGTNAGYLNDGGGNNTFIGNIAGYSNDSGYANTFLGSWAGFANTGVENTILGYYAGFSHTSGHFNTFLGHTAGRYNNSGEANTFLGYQAGFNNTSGYNDIFIGNMAGYNETGSNKLYIADTSTSTPLMYGEFISSIVTINSKLGIGIAPTYPLHMASGAYCSSGGTWTNASSRSLKENIQSLSTDEAVDALNQLNPVKYNYKVDKADKHVGFIAEDVPDLVASADRKGLSPMDVNAVLTKVVQELKRENQEEQNVIQEQQKVLIELHERMAKLEKK